MTKHILYPLLSIVVLICSCSLGGGDFQRESDYNIDDASIRLIIKYEADTIVRSGYEKANSLPGHPCRKLEMTHLLDTSKQLGVTMRFWPDHIINDNHGPFETGKLLEPIKTISVYFEGQDSKKEISSVLTGDQNIGAYVWTNDSHSDPFKSKLLTGGHASRDGGYWSSYIQDVSSLIKRANNYESYSRMYGFDVLFWLDDSVLRELTFRPTLLKMEIEFADSTGSTVRVLTDSTVISNVL